MPTCGPGGLTHASHSPSPLHTELWETLGFTSNLGLGTKKFCFSIRHLNDHKSYPRLPRKDVYGKVFLYYSKKLAQNRENNLTVVQEGNHCTSA